MVWLIKKLLKGELLVVKLKSSLRKIFGRHHDLINRYGIYLSRRWSYACICSICRNRHNPVLLSPYHRTFNKSITMTTVPLMEQVPFWVECHWWSRYRFEWSATDGAGTVLSGVLVVQSLVFCILSTIVCFLGHCIVCPLSMFVSYPLASFNFFFHKFFVSYQHKAVEIS
jgi:ABC-type glycerol-3-phosphate transport system permease component